MDDCGELLLEGSKTFWKTKNTVEVIILEHKYCETLEVIAYEPTFEVEAPRIYLNDKVARSRVDSSVIDGCLRTAKSAAMRRGEAPNVAQLIKGAERTARVNYVLNRLFLKKYSCETKIFVVELQFDFNDRDDEHGGLDVDTMVIEKPQNLKPYAVERKRIPA